MEAQWLNMIAAADKAPYDLNLQKIASPLRIALAKEQADLAEEQARDTAYVANAKYPANSAGASDVYYYVPTADDFKTTNRVTNPNASKIDIAPNQADIDAQAKAAQDKKNNNALIAIVVIVIICFLFYKKFKS